MGILDRRRHQLGRFRAGIAEHDPLIPGPVPVNALGDMGGLGVQQVLHLQGIPVELVLFIPDVPHAAAHDIFDAGQLFGKLCLVAEADFTAHDDGIGCGEGFAGDAGIWLFSKKRVKDGIRDAVTDLVGMSLRNGFGREGIVLT